MTTEINVGGRKAWVFQRRIGGVRQETYYVTGNLPGGKQFRRSTGYSTKTLAVDAAKRLWKAALTGRFKALETTKLKQARTMATIGDVVQAHARAEEEGRLHVRPRVARGYRSALLRAVAWATGHHALPEGGKRRQMDAEAVNRISLAALAAPEFWPDFEVAYLAPAGSDKVQRERLLRGAHAVQRNARAMFEEVALRAYRALLLPDLRHFLKAKIKQPRLVEHHGLDDAAVREMAAAALELKKTDPELYRVHVALRHLGLRNDELCAARVEWIENVQREVRLPGKREMLKLADGRVVEAELPNVRAVAAVMKLVVRSYWEPKRSEGMVAISPDVLAELQPWRAGRKPEEFLIQADTLTDRWELIYRRHADFVRPWTAHLAKRGYELRRWGATKLALLHQSEEMGELFLRHAKKTTAQKHYLTERPLPAPITLVDVGI